MKTDKPAGQTDAQRGAASLSVAEGSADWQAQVDALIDHTRSFVALPTDACVMTSLAAQVLLARKQIARLRVALQMALPVLDEHAEDERSFWGDEDKHGLARDAEKLHEVAKAALSPNVKGEPR